MSGPGGGRDNRERPRGTARPPAAGGPRRPGTSRGRDSGARPRGVGSGFSRRPAGPSLPPPVPPGRARPGLPPGGQPWPGRLRRRVAGRAPWTAGRRGGLVLGNPARRLRLGLLSVAFALSIVSGRLVQLQGLNSAYYRNKAEQERVKPVVIPAERGDITTADGHVLAMTLETDTVTADPPQITSGLKAQAAASLLTKVATDLAGPLNLPEATVLHDLQHPSSPDYQVLAQGVPATAGQRITALMNALGVAGIYLTPTYARAYPDGDLAGNLVGFTSTVSRTQDLAGVKTTTPDLVGEAGIEEQYNRLLAGHDGLEQEETGLTGQQLPVSTQEVRRLVPGGSVRLTILSGLQYEAQQACMNQVRREHADSCTAVVMQPGTGKILALAQWPGYDPSRVASLPSLAPTMDLPVAEAFTPGSTAKVVTAAAALEHGQTPLTAYTVPPSLVVPGGFVVHDAETHPAEHWTLAGILVHSSNIGMSEVVGHVSPALQYRYFRKFGLGRPTGLRLPGENPGTVLYPTKWASLRYTMSYGQGGVTANAVQMASVYATIANGGVRVQPSIVAGTTGPHGKYRPAPPPRRTRVTKASTARELISILQQVPYLDAHVALEPWGVIQGYSVAAKTGTAQEPGPHCALCVYGSSYIGMAPASDPQLVVAVNVQHPRLPDYYGNAVAGPVFYQVMRFALQALKIPPDGGKRPSVPLTAP